MSSGRLWVGCLFLSFFVCSFGDSARCFGVWQVDGYCPLEFWRSLVCFFSWEAELFFRGVNIRMTLAAFCGCFFDRHFPSRLPNTHFNSPSFYPWGLHGGVDIRGTIPPLSRSKKFFLGLSLSRLLLHEHHRHIGIRVLDLHQSDWLLDKTHSASWFTTKYISIPRPKHHITSYKNPPVIFGDFDSTPAQLQPEFERNDHPRSGNKQHKGPPQSPL